MAQFAFRLPDMGEGTTEAELVTWHVKVGDQVSEDQPMVDVMTDKATVEIPAPVSGRIISLVGQPGQILAVGTQIIVFEFETGTVDTHEDAAPAAESKAAPAPRPTLPVPPSPAVPVLPGPGRESSDHTMVVAARDAKPIASPAVRQRAREAGIGLQFIRGTGPAGRITHPDLDAVLNSRDPRSHSATAAPQAETSITELKITGLRRVIAERMQDTKRRIPHFSYIEEVDVTDLEEARRQLNAKWEGKRPKLTMLPFLITALRKAIADHPAVNARFDDEAGIVKQYAGLHVGIATQTLMGLMVPVIRHAEMFDLWQLADSIQRLSGAARDGKSKREDLAGSTITITSLGALGGLATTPIINAPEVAIVGVNKIVHRPTVRGDAIEIRQIMNLSSSFDHRIIDGVLAATFIQSIRSLLEAPILLLSE